MDEEFTIEIIQIERPIGAGIQFYQPEEIERMRAVAALDKLVFVSFRVQHGIDAFAVRVLLSRDIPEDEMLDRARQRAALMLGRAAAETARWLPAVPAS